MDAIRQEIMVPESHDVNLKLHLPDNIPAGVAEVFIIVQSKVTEASPVISTSEASTELGDDEIWGIWEDRDITADSLRESAWKRP